MESKKEIISNFVDKASDVYHSDNLQKLISIAKDYSNDSDKDIEALAYTSFLIRLLADCIHEPDCHQDLVNHLKTIKTLYDELNYW